MWSRGDRAAIRAGFAALSLVLVACPGSNPSQDTDVNPHGIDLFADGTVVLAYNDLGMHCMNENVADLMILPPYNTVHAQVVQRGGEEPRIVTSGVTVSYEIPGNTHSADKTDFWEHAPALLGVSLADDEGLTGNGLSGTMSPTGDNDWSVTGIPLTPITDDGDLDPYQLAQISVTSGGTVVAQTAAVVPVSWEIRCDLCHMANGSGTVEQAILAAHDDRHHTHLSDQRPVLCGDCHAQPELGLNGTFGVPSLSSAMHGAHASRMGTVSSLDTPCYACHPGVETQCLRDVHYDRGMTCVDCHGDMTAVADRSRTPWVDEPRCGDCHERSGFEFEQPNTLYRDAKGHMGIHCWACHGSPHALLPSTQPRDNLQAEVFAGSTDPADVCGLCHTHRPDEGFSHRFGGGDD